MKVKKFRVRLDDGTRPNCVLGKDAADFFGLGKSGFREMVSTHGIKEALVMPDRSKAYRLADIEKLKKTRRTVGRPKQKAAR